MITLSRWAMLGLWLPVAGCTSLSSAPHAFQDGWRQAVVLEVIDPSSSLAPTGAGPDCAAPLASGAGHWAVTSYSRGGNPNLRGKQLTPVPEGTAVQAGDHVLIKLGDCPTPLAKGSVLH